MKVVLVAKSLSKGGAASGARNLVVALRAVDLDVIVFDGFEARRRSLVILARFAERLYERLAHGTDYHCMRLAKPTLNLEKIYKDYRPDIVQLCDVSGNTVSFRDISRIPCPVVHRLSDFWPYHGAHHYAEKQLTQNKLADSLLRNMIFDGSAHPWCRVAPSHWLAGRLSGSDIRVIRNAVALPDLITVRTVLPRKLRFGFISALVSDPRKGFGSLRRYLEVLSQCSSSLIELHVFGRAVKSDLLGFTGVEIIHHEPFAHSDLTRVFECFDILLCPSILDNSPNVVTEALAHGVPVIGQSGTGMESYINERIGGLVDFHAGTKAEIQLFVRISNRIVAQYGKYSGRASHYAREELAPAVIGAEYKKLYQELLARG